MNEDEKIMLHCLKFIKRETKYVTSGHINMLTTLWKNWDDYKQTYFRDLLWDKKYVHLAPYQFELQITTEGKDFITAKDKELRDSFFAFLIEERNVVDFMIDNFVKPDDLSPETKNETDDGIVFLKELRRKKLIRFDDAVLEQVNNWVIPKSKNKHRRWFDTLTEKLIIIPTNPAHEDVFLDRTPLIKPKIPQRIKTHIGITWLVRNLNKLSMKNIIEMIIAAIVAGAVIAWLIWYFGYNDVRTHPPTGAPRKIEVRKPPPQIEG